MSNAEKQLFTILQQVDENERYRLVESLLKAIGKMTLVSCQNVHYLGTDMIAELYRPEEIYEISQLIEALERMPDFHGSIEGKCK